MTMYDDDRREQMVKVAMGVCTVVAVAFVVAVIVVLAHFVSRYW